MKRQKISSCDDGYKHLNMSKNEVFPLKSDSGRNRYESISSLMETVHPLPREVIDLVSDSSDQEDDAI